MIWVVVLLVIVLLLVLITYIDYRKYRRPLAQIDIIASKKYTYMHHMRMVSFPMMRYRFSISLQKKSDMITKF